MRKVVVRLSITLLFAPLIAGLLWYGVTAFRLAEGDEAFMLTSGSADFFSTPWVRRGDSALLAELSPEKAAADYREAISRQVVNLNAWFALADVELTVGNEESASRILGFLSPVLQSVTTWKWDEFILAYKLRDESVFSRCMNFILSRMGNRQWDAPYVAYQFWGDNWSAVISHVEAENASKVLYYLMSAGAVGPSMELWDRFEQRLAGQDASIPPRFSHFLIGRGSLPAAKRVWRFVKNDGAEGVYNGGFEQELLRKSFGWRAQKHDQIEIERSPMETHNGRYALHIKFPGTENVSFGHFYQIVPVTPGKSYSLVFARKTHKLTTDRGVYVRVRGFKCGDYMVRSEPLLGNNPWKEETLRFTVPDGCEAIVLSVQRDKSLKFDSKISGDYWLDDVRLIPVEQGLS